MTNVDTNALASGAERSQGVGDVHINLAGVGLTGDDERRAESGLLSDELIQLLNLLVVTVEDLEERSLSTGGTLDTTETQVVAGPLKVSQIHQQVLKPQACSLSDGDELGGLSVGETKAGQILVLVGERGKLINHDGELGDQDIESVAEEDQIGIVGAVARSGTPVDDTGGSGGNLAERMNVSHDVVPPALLLLGGNLELVILNGEVGLHLLNGIAGNGQTEFYASESTEDTGLVREIRGA